MPYSIKYILAAMLLLFLFPFMGIRNSFSKAKNWGLAIFFIILMPAFLVYAGFSVRNFKEKEYMRNINNEYNICLNWKSQIDMEERLCQYGKNKEPKKCATEARHKIIEDFNQRRKRKGLYDINLYDRPGMKSLKKPIFRLKACAICVTDDKSTEEKSKSDACKCIGGDESACIAAEAYIVKFGQKDI